MTVFRNPCKAYVCTCIVNKCSYVATGPGTYFLLLYVLYIYNVEVRNLNYTKVGDGDNTSLIVTWDPAVNPQCGGVLLYLVTISSSCSVMDNIIIVTDLSKSTATFSNLRNIGYNVTVAAVSRTSVGVTSITTTSGNNNGSGKLLATYTYVRIRSYMYMIVDFGIATQIITAHARVSFHIDQGCAHV